MKTPIAPLVLALAGCAAAPPPLSSDSAPTRSALASWKACVATGAAGYRGTVWKDRPADSAVTVGGLVARGCDPQLAEVNAAVVQENASHPQRRTFADAYTRTLREQARDGVAAAILKAP